MRKMPTKLHCGRRNTVLITAAATMLGKLQGTKSQYDPSELQLKNIIVQRACGATIAHFTISEFMCRSGLLDSVAAWMPFMLQ